MSILRNFIYAGAMTSGLCLLSCSKQGAVPVGDDYVASHPKIVGVAPILYRPKEERVALSDAADVPEQEWANRYPRTVQPAPRRTQWSRKASTASNLHH